MQLNLNGIELQKLKSLSTGWKTSDLLNGIADSTLNEYNLVSLLIGVNNNSGVSHLMFFKLNLIHWLISQKKLLAKNVYSSALFLTMV